jgi:hypothetical protein
LVSNGTAASPLLLLLPPPLLLDSSPPDGTIEPTMGTFETTEHPLAATTAAPINIRFMVIFPTLFKC